MVRTPRELLRHCDDRLGRFGDAARATDWPDEAG
jgi:hypothetical protein